MFVSEEEDFRKALFEYTAKCCDAHALFIKDYELDGYAGDVPYAIVTNKHVKMFKNRILQDGIKAFAITYGEWKGFESLKIPHISYVCIDHYEFDDVVKVYISASDHFFADEQEGEDFQELNDIMKKYKKRFFSGAGMEKYNIYGFSKN